MKKILIAFLFLLVVVVPAAAQQPPLYIVNGKPAEDIASIPPEDIEKVEMLPADEQTIALYGPQAAHGVMLITLRYDQPAAFLSDTTSFSQYIARQIRWDADEPAARVVLRYTITPDGKTIAGEQLESTDSRLKRRVLKALAEAPKWRPAHKNGTPIESDGVLHIQLPEGKRMPRPVELVFR